MIEATTTGLWDGLQPLLTGRSFTDLTHAFHPGQPHFPAFPDEVREPVFDLEKGDGFTAHRYSIIGQWGTHVDPPSHFISGGRTLDQIPVEEMVLPLVILDITEHVVANADATPTMEDVLAWESRNGPIAPGAFVALRTGWSDRWPDAGAMANRDDDGVSHANCVDSPAADEGRHYRFAPNRRAVDVQSDLDQASGESSHVSSERRSVST